MSASVNIIIPEKRADGGSLKTLWLLHGMHSDHTSWCRYTGIERYAEGRNLCIVMPAVDLSLYTDMLSGNNYFTYITGELPEVLAGMLPLSPERADNYVAGFSMGGYGALKAALNFPAKYAMVASLSGAVDRIYSYDRNDDMNREIFNLAFGDMDKFTGSISDLRHMAEKRRLENNLPKLYMCCGTDDFLYGENLQYLEHLKSLGVPVTWEEDEGYAHTWEYWDLKIQRVLEWMGL